jgi:hypothetical protein
MKRIILRATFFLSCFVCLTASVSFGGGPGFSPPQSGKSIINSKFGFSNQIGAGVNIHFATGHEKDLDMIAAAGFKFIRMDFGWQGTEPTKGTYNWASYDELTANLEKRGLSAIYIFDYSSSLYEESVVSKDSKTDKGQKILSSPQHPESVAAFARWAAAAAEHFKGSKIIWEIWNEPNISQFWKPTADVVQYTVLALATCKAVKAVVPDAIIIGPATSTIPFPFLESFLASGVLEYLDAVSVHPYRNYSRSPETAITDYKKLRELIDRYAPAKKRGMPIISSEWGYSTFNKGVTLETQAAYITRMQLCNMLSGIPISIWYDWKNDGNDPAEPEHNFGTVSSDLKPTPAYISIQTMNMQLKGFTFLRRIELKNDNDYVLLFKNDKGSYKISAWTMDPAHTSATAMEGNGNALKLKTEKNRLVLDLDALPQYITLPRGIKMK